MIKSSKNFDFSVVIPVYNVEEYLEESILSVINQTYSFKEHIQIVLVNDGSPDNSEEICLKYQKLYPENIIYIKQDNAGVSAARNNGLEYAQGEYINFLDSDDIWESDAFYKIKEFINNNNGIEVLCCKIKHFEGATYLHPLSRRLTDTRIVNIYEEENYTFPHLQVSSSFIRRDYATSIRFEKGLIIGEDALYLNKLILRAGRYASMPEVQYNYRTRLSQSSAIQTKGNNIKYYNETVEKYYGGMIQASIDICGSVIPYMQSLLVYDIGWRVTQGKPEVLTQQQYDEYCAGLSKILSYVEDRFIITHPIHRSFFKKYSMLRLKYNEDITNKFTYNAKNKFMYLCDVKITKIPKNPDHCEIYSIEHKNGELIVEGLIKTWIIDADCTTDFVLSFAGKEYPAELKIFPHSYENTMFGRKYTNYQFISRIPFDEAFDEKSTRWIYPRLYFGDEKANIAMHCGGKKMFSTIQCPAAYNILDEYYYIPTEKGIKFVKPDNIQKAEKKLNRSFNKWVYKNNKKATFIRFLYQLIKPFRKKPLWIVSDRMDIANDNGEMFFRYLCEKKPEDIDYEFVISKDSPDAEKIKSIGKTVYFESLKYKLHFLLADKIISSQANEENLNAFDFYDYKYFYNICDFDFVFLQHGIIMNDLSSWLNRKNKKIDLFITSAKSEQQSIICGDYGLDEIIVKLTGLSRFDRLYELKNNVKKQVIIMPTWRRSINLATVNLDEEQGKILFLQSDYCKFYNKLINDERLLNVMKDNGCTGKFCLHPMHYDKTDCFFENEIFKVANGSINYQELFTQGALMITDYSSTFFDFCYLNKPVIYTQFDREEFFEGQIYNEGYFKYERDGFGPVCETYDETVNKIIELIENDFQIEPIYEARIKNFYAYHDNHNCDRIYDAILDMDKR